MELRRRAKGEAVQREYRERVEGWRKDFSSFAGLLDIIPLSGGTTKLRPNCIQSAFEVSRSGRDIVLKPRQIGFTTYELARDVWFFLTRPGANVVIVTQSVADDSSIKEISGKVSMMLDSLKEQGVNLAFGTHTASHWTLPENKSSLKIIGAGASAAAAAKKGRSGTIHRLHVTECALFEFARETLNAILECVPALENGTEIVIESTPNGAHGAFHERYTRAKSGKDSYTAHFYPWSMREEYATPLADGERIEPRDDRERELVRKLGITAEQLKWYRGKVGDKGQDLTDQEYPSDDETCFLSGGGEFFDAKTTTRLIANARPPVAVEKLGDGTLRILERVKHGEQYVVSADPSEGTGGDPGAAIVYERRTGHHVATMHGQYSTWNMGIALAELGKRYNWALVAVERNNHGHAVLQSLVHQAKYPGHRIFSDTDKKLGWINSETSRATALEAFHNAHQSGRWTSTDDLVLNEMRKFVNLNGKPQAASGAHDDLILASAIGWDVLRRVITTRDVTHLPPA